MSCKKPVLLHHQQEIALASQEDWVRLTHKIIEAPAIVIPRIAQRKRNLQSDLIKTLRKLIPLHAQVCEYGTFPVLHDYGDFPDVWYRLDVASNGNVQVALTCAA